jgi:hypothetical protein
LFISKATWDYFNEIYGYDDDPMVRSRIDIYAKELPYPVAE